MASKKIEQKLRVIWKVKKAIINFKKKETVEKYKSDIYVTKLANMYNVSKSTISTIFQRKNTYKKAITCEKARAINEDLLKNNPSMSDNYETFHSIKG